ncbi:S-layer homology domain-containing protein [Paenibacillus sp. FSL H8-0034]|uniref:S-layer homology domain-containing protein n=1 Tax=Paenibacillus sp. FSL H8-0034 TaxID=2954671 RepID=UPI0030F5CA64
MKKTLSFMVVMALFFTVLTSISFAADEKTPLEKYEILKGMGIFEGTEKGADLEALTNRAQFAKIIGLVWNLKEDEQGASVYQDLAGYEWASGYIGAATKAGFFDGVAEGQFAPGDNITVEQLAAVLVRAFKLESGTEAVNGKVSDWAKGYVAAAIQAGLIATAADYTVDARRSDLVVSTYGAVQFKLHNPMK